MRGRAQGARGSAQRESCSAGHLKSRISGKERLTSACGQEGHPRAGPLDGPGEPCSRGGRADTVLQLNLREALKKATYQLGQDTGAGTA